MSVLHKIDRTVPNQPMERPHTFNKSPVLSHSHKNTASENTLVLHPHIGTGTSDHPRLKKKNFKHERELLRQYLGSRLNISQEN